MALEIVRGMKEGVCYLVHEMLLCKVVDEAMEAVGVVSAEGGSRNEYRVLFDNTDHRKARIEKYDRKNK